MALQIQARPPLALLLALAQVALAAVVVVAGASLDRADRSTGPESPVLAYAIAVEKEDLAGALDQLAPELRESSESFVAWELGNRYTILESVVRAGSLLDRLTGKDASNPRVVVSMEIHGKGQTPWRAVDELPVQQIGARWYLLKVPLK